MGFFQARIWKNSFFKNIGFLFSSEKKIIKIVLIGESGLVSLENLALAAGHCYNDQWLAGWAVIQKLKLRMEGSDEMVLPVSDRSYIPLDPHNKLTQEDRERLVALTDIATDKYHQAFTRVSEENKKNANQKLLTTLIYGILLITIICVIVVMVKKK